MTLARWMVPHSELEPIERAVDVDTAHHELGGLQINITRASNGFVVRTYNRYSEYAAKHVKDHAPTLHLITDQEDFTVALTQIITMQCLVR